MTELDVRPARTTALDFYERLLGCTWMDRPELGIRGAWLLAGDMEVHLIETAVDETTGSAPKVAKPLANHVAFQVDDLERFSTHLEDEDLRPVRGLISGMQQLFVQDPSGNVIEFTSATR